MPQKEKTMKMALWIVVILVGATIITNGNTSVVTDSDNRTTICKTNNGITVCS